jgi:hypothetical protein
MDPTEEWRRLTEEYRQMSEEELRNLAAAFDDLTDTAKQALRQEMRSRGLGDPLSPEAAPPLNAPPPSNAPAASAIASIEPDLAFENPAIPVGSFFDHMPKLVSGAPAAEEGDSGPHDYTWKTALCDCDTVEQAQALSAALLQAGLDSWIQGSHEFGRRYARVLVAADQLDRARVITAGPAPQEFISESKEEIPQFVEPQCPKCGSDDVVLEGVDTQNHWRCEACDAEWSDAAEPADGKPANPIRAAP